LLTQGEVQAVTKYNAKRFEYYVSTDRCGLIQLGTLNQPTFKFQIRISQPQPGWEGNPGIFLGYHPEDPSRFQCIYFEKRQGYPKEKEYALHRSIGKIGESLYGKHIGVDGITSQEIPDPSLREQLLEIFVRNHTLAKVHLNGREMNQLTGPNWEKFFQPRDFQGRMGIYNVTTCGNYKDANLQIILGNNSPQD
jgi:hypothetical protein